MREFELIRRYFTGHDAGTGVVLGVGDDGAVLQVPPDQELVISTDTSVAGVHFPPDLPARAVGHRALAVNLSDLAAMGAEPRWATLALTLPEVDEAWVAEFAAGFTALARLHGVALVGGDTTRGPLSITVTVHGVVPAGQALRRAGARVGDVIAVTGTPGDAAGALMLIQGRLDPEVSGVHALAMRFHFPEPRLAVGRALRGLAHACIDVSDGLLADLGHILSASGVGARLELAALPRSVPLELAVPERLWRDLQTAGGDDYELLFTLAAADWPAFAPRAAELGCALTRIGSIEAEPGLRCFTQDGAVWQPVRKGHEHFA